jgi:hypothetical protein
MLLVPSLLLLEWYEEWGVGGAGLLTGTVDSEILLNTSRQLLREANLHFSLQ